MVKAAYKRVRYNVLRTRGAITLRAIILWTHITLFVARRKTDWKTFKFWLWTRYIRFIWNRIICLTYQRWEFTVMELIETGKMPRSDFLTPVNQNYKEEFYLEDARYDYPHTER